MPIAKRMAKMGVEVLPYTSVTGFDGGSVKLTSVLTGDVVKRPAAALVTITGRLPVDELFEQLRDRWQQAGIASVTRVGDCWAPSTIQQAVYTGHKWARGLDEEPETLIPRELPMIESGRVNVTW
jgi:dimethylamine/trimethylamine dehydrogenase